jgi:hypothetical protein
MIKFKYVIFFLFYLTLFNSQKLAAQNDSVPLFRSSDEIRNASKGYYKHVFYVNCSTLLRGGFSLGYEKYFAVKGVSLFVQAGYTARDFSGQYNWSEFESIFENYDTYKDGLRPGYMFELGSKYYLKNATNGNYFSLSYAHIVNTRVRNFDDYIIVPFSTERFYLVDYLSKEIKIMYGSSTETDSKFYSDWAVGSGIRFLKYDHVEFQTIAEASEDTDFRTVKTYSKSVKNEIKPWLFFTWKIGFRF